MIGPGVYYYIDPYYYSDPAEEMTIYKLDYKGNWYVLDASQGEWNIMKEATPYCGLDKLKKY